MYRVVLHPDVVDDLFDHFDHEAAGTLIRKTVERLARHPEPDGRVIKRLHHLVTAVFFEYKARLDWRAIFYLDEQHHEVRVLGFVPKSLGTRLFDRRLEALFQTRYRF